MKNITIYIDRLNPHQTSQLTKAISIINGSQNYFSLSNKYKTLDLGESAIIGIEKFEEIFIEKKGDDKAIYLTEKKFDDNYFSHDFSATSVISIHGWESEFAPPSLRCYIIYEIIQALIAFEGEIPSELNCRISHKRTVGCVMDYCIHKPDIKLGMTSGNLCLECRSNLSRLGASIEALDAIDRILVHVRAEAIGKPISIDPNRAFIIMRFSNNDENDNAYLYGIKPGLEAVGIKPERADNVVPSSQILDKIKKYIDKYRFVVAKIDEDNLNVYFELGLAMGSNKDVLLISESNISLNLPTDLKNWNCLIYGKGNYKELENKIVNYYHEYYGLKDIRG